MKFKNIRNFNFNKPKCISVSDTGIGISPEIIEKIFDPFFTTKEIGKGTGLGLFLSRETVLAHGGSLSLESETGHGTTVTVTLPGLKSAQTRAL